MKVGMGVVLLCMAALTGCGDDGSPPDRDSGSYDPTNIVVIGDSYSSGNGAGNYSDDRRECLRSRDNWGEIYRDDFSSRYGAKLRNEACSGAVLRDLTEPKGSLPPQWDAVDGETDLVLMTIGGNDVGFKEIAKNCLVFAKASCERLIDEARRGIPSLEGELTALLAKLRDRLRPDARVVLVSYPFLVGQKALQGCSRFSRARGYEIAANVRQLGVLGDRAQVAAVNAANEGPGARTFYLGGVKTKFKGHEPAPCLTKFSNESWLHDPGPRDIVDLIEYYHFNPRGHRAVADLLSEQGDLMEREPPRYRLSPRNPGVVLPQG
ncbi:MAG TPA: SGNH/GDSL hydrolase family protein [Solirubrobacterales bacterium]|nr:SGNH/GDSL hydrolase family protein [Solirubrobacterales bacterium]